MVKADAKLVPSLCSWCSRSRRQPGREDREGAGVELVRPGVAVPRRPAAPPPTGLVCPGGKCATSPTRITSQLLPLVWSARGESAPPFPLASLHSFSHWSGLPGGKVRHLSHSHHFTASPTGLVCP